MKLSVVDQCEILHYVGYIPCAASETLTAVIAADGSIESMICSDCDSGNPTSNKRGACINEAESEMFSTLQTLLETREFQHTVEPRVRAMLAVRKLVAHSRSFNHLNLAVSFCGKWCLQSHCSTLRELRIAAGYLRPEC